MGRSKLPKLAGAACASQSWSVALSYLLHGYGADVTATDLRTFSGQGVRCMPLDDYRQLKACRGRWTDAQGRAFSLTLNDLPSLDDPLPEGDVIARISQALTRSPLLCGAAGHTTLVSEIVLWDHPTWGLRWHEVRVLDPMAPGRPRALTERELARPFFMLQAEIAAI